MSEDDIKRQATSLGIPLTKQKRLTIGTERQPMVKVLEAMEKFIGKNDQELFFFQVTNGMPELVVEVPLTKIQLELRIKDHKVPVKDLDEMIDDWVAEGGHI